MVRLGCVLVVTLWLGKVDVGVEWEKLPRMDLDHCNVQSISNRETFIMLVLYIAIYMYVFIVLFYSFCMHGRVTINVQGMGCRYIYVPTYIKLIF